MEKLRSKQSQLIEKLYDPSQTLQFEDDLPTLACKKCGKWLYKLSIFDYDKAICDNCCAKEKEIAKHLNELQTQFLAYAKAALEAFENPKEITLPLLIEGYNTSHVFRKNLELKNTIKVREQSIDALEKKIIVMETNEKKLTNRMLVMQQSLDALNKELRDMKSNDEKMWEERYNAAIQRVHDLLKTDIKEKEDIENKVENIEIEVKHILEEKINEFKEIKEDTLKNVRDELKKGESDLNKAVTQVTDCHSQVVEIHKEYHKVVHDVRKNNVPQKITNLEKLMLTPNREMTCFQLANINEKYHPDFTWNIIKIKSKLPKRKFEIRSDNFVLSNYPIQTHAKLEWSENNEIYVSLKLQPDAHLDLKIMPSICFVLRNQRMDYPDKYHLSRKVLCPFSKNSANDIEYTSRLFLKQELSHFNYNIYDSIVIDILAEPPSMAHLSFSNNGILEWSVNNFQLRQQLEMSHQVWTQESPYFYTSEEGYRVQVAMYVNGYKGYSGLTVQVVFLTGEFDDTLPKIFSHKTTVTLLNRNNPKLNIIKCKMGDIPDEKYYDINMESHGKIQQLLENDTLFCKVQIETGPAINVRGTRQGTRSFLQRYFQGSSH